MEKIEVILTNCIKEIRTGKATLAECLERYPSRRAELEPLLKMALNIQEPSLFQLEPGYKQTAKAQLLRQISTAKQTNIRTWAGVFSFGLPPQLVWARVAIALVIGVVLISMMGGSSAYAAQGSLPGEILYPVKTLTEEVRLWMAGDSVDKAELNLEFAQTRLVELSRLTENNSDQTELAVRGYGNSLQAASSDMQNITDTAILAGVLGSSAQKLGEQIYFCDRMFDVNARENKSIQGANALAVNAQIKILTRLAQQNNLHAARVNLDMMQNRLQRALAKANEYQYLTMQEAMLQYQQYDELGQQILRNAHNTQNQASEIDDISGEVLYNCLEILDTLSQQVPKEYQNILEATQTMTTQFQEQTHYGYQHQGGFDGGTDQTTGRKPDATPISEDSGTAVEESPSDNSQSKGSTPNAPDITPGNTATPTPDNPENSGSEGGSGTGGSSNSGGGGSSNTGGNTGDGSGTGSGGGAGSGGSSGSNSGSSSGSGGGGKH